MASPIGCTTVRRGTGETHSSNNIHVSGLPPGMRDEQLHSLFSPCGDVVVAKVMMNVRTSQTKGYGFVLFKTDEAGAHAIAVMNGRSMSIDGHEVTLKCSVSQHDGVQALAESKGVYVRNVPDRVSSHELRHYFTQFGPVQDLQVKTDYKQPWFSLVSVTFADVESARKAVRGTHNTFVFSGPDSVPVLAKFADGDDKSRRKEGATSASGSPRPRRGARQDVNTPPLLDGSPLVSHGENLPLYNESSGMARRASSSLRHVGTTPLWEEDFNGVVYPDAVDFYGASYSGASSSGASSPRSRPSTPYRHDPYSAEGYVLEPCRLPATASR